MKTLLVSLAILVIPFSQPVGKPASTSKNPKAQEKQEQRLEKKEEIQQRIQERTEARLERKEQRQATREARLAEIRKQKITVFFERLTTRFEALIARLEKLIGRIESRLAKIAESNEDIDTAPIQEQLDLAKEKLAEAEAALGGTEDNLDEWLESPDPKETFKVIKGAIQEVKRDLVEVHRILVHVIGDIKGLRVGATGETSQTPEATASASPTATASATTSPTPTPTVSPSPEPTVSPTPTATPTE